MNLKGSRVRVKQLFGKNIFNLKIETSEAYGHPNITETM
jgi:hypothetical protein